MTRKKTTTGTMGSKRKSDTRTKDRPAGEKAKARESEHKANEVIPEVACALLETHPSLPDRAMILDQFSGHFRASKERAAAQAAQAAEAAAHGTTETSEKDPAGARKRRPAIDPVSRTATRPPIDPVSRPAVRPPIERPPSRPHTPAPAVVQQIAAVSTPVAEVAAPAAAPMPEPVRAPEPVSLFAELESEVKTSDSDDLLALLRDDAPAARGDEDFDFSYQTMSDQSSPFAASPIEHTPLPGEGATMMLSVAEDDSIFGTPIAQEAFEVIEPSKPMMIAPSESTTMIQAMPDDDAFGQAAPSAGDEPAEADAGRKSRKTSKKRRG